jgi:hypothetical protein
MSNFNSSELQYSLTNESKVGASYDYGYGYGYGYANANDNVNDNANATATATGYEFVKEYFNPIRIDLSLNISNTDLYGGANSKDTINSFNINNLKKQYLTNIDGNLKIYFTENNKEQINNSFYFAKGEATSIYKIKFDNSNNFPYYNNKECIMRLQKIDENINDLITRDIKKYTEDLHISEATKKYFIDILYYGIINDNDNNNLYYYKIVPIYDTDLLLLNKLSSKEKKIFIKNVINMLILFNQKKKFINDLKIVNISIFETTLEPKLIDYDFNTINDSFKINGQYLHSYYNTKENKNQDKIYHVFIAQLIYQFYFLGKYDKIEQIEIPFDSLFINIKYIDNKNYYVLKDYSEYSSKLQELLDKNIFFGIEDILYLNGKGLLATNYNDILSLDEVYNLVTNIFDKPTENDIFNENTIEKINKYISNSIFFVNKYGVGIKNFTNENLNKFTFSSFDNYDKPRKIHYYLRKNKWNIIYYDDSNSELIKDNTLKYALQCVGCIHSVKMNGKNQPPEFTLHINNDFKNKYGYFFDNCRVLEDEQWVLFFWIVEITNMFNIISVNYSIDKLIYINIHDHPIYKNSDEIIYTDPEKHPFPDVKLHLKNEKKLFIPITVKPDEKYPIYCWPSKKNYRDIGLPFHDIWMHLLCYDFGKDFNIDNYKINEYVNKPLEAKIGKAFFRGSYTNCSFPVQNSVRLKSHILSLQNNNNAIDSYVVGGPKAFKYQHFDHSYLQVNGLDYFMEKDKFYDAKKQPEFRYILNLDGFASAFRIIKELYYNSIIIIPESEFTDVIRDVLKPWVHYVPCKSDLSNIIELIKWCNNNLMEMDKILKNMINIRDEIISIESMLTLSINKLQETNWEVSQKIKLNDKNEIIIKIPDINDDNINKLNKTVEVSWIQNDKIIRKENIYYQKYLKYKQKYLALKNNMN